MAELSGLALCTEFTFIQQEGCMVTLKEDYSEMKSKSDTHKDLVCGQDFASKCSLSVQLCLILTQLAV